MQMGQPMKENGKEENVMGWEQKSILMDVYM